MGEKYDFLSGIKSEQPIKTRVFQDKKSRDERVSVATVHPSIQAEIDAIMRAHEEARGPSLIDEHRSKKSRQKLECNKDKPEWKWKKSDLDNGRRVDKNALGMILGGAADSLK